MQLSQKEKAFSQFFYVFLKSILKFEHFQKKKMTLIADVVAKLRTPKSMVKQISKNSRFREPFHKQHAKANQPLLISERHHIYHIY